MRANWIKGLEIRLLPKSAYKEQRPSWLKVRYANSDGYNRISQALISNDLNTVCETANCPNIFDCYDRSSLTFLILGEKCSRSCSFCRVESSSCLPLDLDEPKRVARTTAELMLKKVVITSVARDDIQDGGSDLFASTIRFTKAGTPDCTVEALIPDFQGKRTSLRNIFRARPHILAHNIETVKRLYENLRPEGDYKRSLKVLSLSKQAGFVTKSGIMVGLGEKREEVVAAMKDAYESGVDIFTIGQYLSPSPDHHPISRYYDPLEFEVLRSIGMRIGFTDVISGPLVRSSYDLGKTDE